MDLLIRGGDVYDGDGGPGRRADVAVTDGRVSALAPALTPGPDTRVVEAAGCWVTPGFVDLHTHYDAEVEVLPGLTESLRHGVTTVLVGSCGLSMAVGTPDDLADMFCRVEGLPRADVLRILGEHMDWRTPVEYLDHLDRLPLGPNVTALLGHSAIRAHVLGLGRSLDHRVRPDTTEMAELEAILDEAIVAGYLGLSINNLTWDKMGGTRYRSRPTPSVFASRDEYRRLIDVVRRHDALFQAIPNVSDRKSIFWLLAESCGVGRAPVRTSLLTLADTPAAPGVYRWLAGLTNTLNRFGRAEVRFQSLPTPFDVYSDGLEVPVIEEFGAGTDALHLEDPDERARLLRDPAYRRRFARQWTNRLASRAYHRDLGEARVVGCPDASVVGRTFAEVAAERGVTPVECFLDLNAEHGGALRWYSVIANARADRRQWIMANPAAMIGFSDAGAHLRNMAFYNFPLRMLRQVRDADTAGRPFMTVGRAVQRLTSEIADFLGVDAGRLRVGDRADIAVVDPSGLDDTVEVVHEAPLEGFGDLRRLVRRNDATVPAVVVNGRLAWHDGQPGPDLASGCGTLLRRVGTDAGATAELTMA